MSGLARTRLAESVHDAGWSQFVDMLAYKAQRYGRSTLAYTLAGIIGGAIAPLLFTSLLSAYGTWVPLAACIAVASAVSLAGIFLGRDPEAAVDEDAALATPKTRGTVDATSTRRCPRSLRSR